MAAKKKARKAGSKTAAKAGSKKAGGSSTKGVGRNVDLEAVRRRIVNHVGGKAFDMVKNTSDALTKTTNVMALKYLFEMIGLFPAGEAPVNSEDDENLAALFMKRLGLPEVEPEVVETVLDAAGAANESVEEQGITLHAVE